MFIPSFDFAMTKKVVGYRLYVLHRNYFATNSKRLKYKCKQILPESVWKSQLLCLFSLKDFRAMFFLCSVFGCGQVSSSLCVGLVKLASLETNRYSFFLCFGTKKLYGVVVVVLLLLFF